MKITAAEASWSNGISELHNVTLTDIIVKVKKDLNCDWEAALAWAGSTKNCLIKVSSFSPHGAIFGTNIILVSIYNDKLSADLLHLQIFYKIKELLHISQLYMLQDKHL